MRFHYLFSPLQIGPMQIRNRMVIPAMHLGAAEGGFVNKPIIEFYRRRAQGGVGMIIVGGMGVSTRGAGAPLMISIKDDSYLPQLTRLASQVHKEGAKICAQLYHAGAYSYSQITGEQAVSSSDKYSKFTHETPRALSTSEVAEVVDTIVDAGLRAEKAGFDAVEILSSAGYLIDQFLSPLKNNRKDRYGGPALQDRLTFPLEIISKMKTSLSSETVIGCRLSGDDFVPGSNTYKEKKLIAKAYADSGVQYLNVTGGWHETRVPQLPMDTPRGAFAYLAKEIKQSVTVPVFASNRINDPILAEHLLEDFYADAICFGRAMVADPDLPQKIQNGHVKDIRRCIGCNQGCFDGIFQLKTLRCTVNPLAMSELKYATPEKVTRPNKVAIIGAGPAGLEAARVLVQNGHHVVIYEKSGAIGGQVNVAWVPPGRGELKSVIEYYANQMVELGADLRLNSSPSPEEILAGQFDYVFCATGVNFKVPNIKGLDPDNDPHVIFADYALAGDAPIGKDVAVIGGAATGIETALWAAKRGAMDPEVARFLSYYGALPAEKAMERTYRGDRNITIIEYLPKIGTSVGKSTKWVFLDELKKLGVHVIVNAEIQEIQDNMILYRLRSSEDDSSSALSEIGPFDTLLLATGVEPNREFGENLKLHLKRLSKRPQTKIKYLGDAKKVGTILDAVHSGFKQAYKLGVFRP